MNESSSSCPFCRCEVGFDEDIVACPECRVLYHEGCWEENSGCARYGCEGKMDDDRGKIVITMEDVNAPPPSRLLSEPIEEPAPEETPNPNYDDSTGCEKIMSIIGWGVMIFFVLRQLERCS
jgi:hypothetical protein